MCRNASNHLNYLHILFYKHVQIRLWNMQHNKKRHGVSVPFALVRFDFWSRPQHQHFRRSKCAAASYPSVPCWAWGRHKAAKKAFDDLGVKKAPHRQELAGGIRKAAIREKDGISRLPKSQTGDAGAFDRAGQRRKNSRSRTAWGGTWKRAETAISCSRSISIQRMRCQLRTERISGFGGTALNKHFSQVSWHLHCLPVCASLLNTSLGYPIIVVFQFIYTNTEPLYSCDDSSLLAFFEKCLHWNDTIRIIMSI